MKYPREVGPTTQTELFAWLFTMLGNAYNMLAQYEADERQREEEERRRVFDESLTGMREETIRKRAERFRSEAAHKEDEA